MRVPAACVLLLALAPLGQAAPDDEPAIVGIQTDLATTDPSWRVPLGSRLRMVTTGFPAARGRVVIGLSVTANGVECPVLAFTRSAIHFEVPEDSVRPGPSTLRVACGELSAEKRVTLVPRGDWEQLPAEKMARPRRALRRQPRAGGLELTRFELVRAADGRARFLVAARSRAPQVAPVDVALWHIGHSTIPIPVAARSLAFPPSGELELAFGPFDQELNLGEWGVTITTNRVQVAQVIPLGGSEGLAAQRRAIFDHYDRLLRTCERLMVQVEAARALTSGAVDLSELDPATWEAWAVDSVVRELVEAYQANLDFQDRFLIAPEGELRFFSDGLFATIIELLVETSRTFYAERCAELPRGLACIPLAPRRVDRPCRETFEAHRDLLAQRVFGRALPGAR